MTKRFIFAILFACIASQLVNGQENDTVEAVEITEITVNANHVNQGLTALQTGTSRLGHRMTIDYSPMNCQVRRQPGKKYFGTVATSGNWIESEDICVSVCWQYKIQGYPCESVNYIATRKTCELMQDAYQGGNGLVSDSSSTYVVAVSCQKPGQPTQPTAAPQPQPQPGGGNSGNIRPGSCGQSSVPQRFSRALLGNSASAKGQRIVGGNEARPHSVPFIVSLRSGNYHYCGGTLIRVNNKDESDIVVTAAHCMSQDGSANFNVVAGAHRKSSTAQGEQSVAASRVVIHPNYGRGVPSDIAVVKLSRPIKFSQTIQPACLPAQGEKIGDNVNGIVAGWGALREGASGPEALNQVIVPTISPSTCRQMYGNTNADTELCGGFEQGQKDSCQGDSGGPYFFEGRNGYTLHGVVSWGSGCAQPRAPGVYARVSHFADWIQQQVRSMTSL